MKSIDYYCDLVNIYHDLIYREKNIEKEFNNDMNIVIFKLDHYITTRFCRLYNKYFAKKIDIIEEPSLLLMYDDFYFDPNETKQYIKDIICLKIYNIMCNKHIRVMNKIKPIIDRYNMCNDIAGVIASFII